MGWLLHEDECVSLLIIRWRLTGWRVKRRWEPSVCHISVRGGCKAALSQSFRHHGTRAVGSGGLESVCHSMVRHWDERTRVNAASICGGDRIPQIGIGSHGRIVVQRWSASGGHLGDSRSGWGTRSGGEEEPAGVRSRLDCHRWSR